MARCAALNRRSTHRIAKRGPHHGIPAIYPQAQFVIERAPQTRLFIKIRELFLLRPETFESAFEALDFVKRASTRHATAHRGGCNARPTRDA